MFISKYLSQIQEIYTLFTNTILVNSIILIIIMKTFNYVKDQNWIEEQIGEVRKELIG